MKIYFIGIGGIGVSALAQYYLAKGHEVSGSDLVASEITDFLKNKGANINIGHQSDSIRQGIDLVIYSPAVKPDNLEYKKAKELGIKAQSYPEALGDLTKQYFTIAVSGAHGKSTTTAILALVLIKAGLDPTVIVGTKVKEFGDSNFRPGKSKILVIEACEYDSSFLNYKPKIIIVTNVDKEHLDYFKTFANVKKAFENFMILLPADGFLVFNNDNEFIPRFEQPKFKTISYSLDQPEAKKIKKILKVPGLHNVSNALAVLQVARILKIPDKITLKALAEFQGTWRRFETIQSIINNKKITIISDYGHHPTEILATLKAAREKYPKKFILCVFQPHQYQRTFYLFDDFIKVFRIAPIDELIITDIYDVAGREIKKIKKGVNAKKLVKNINRKNVEYFLLCDIEKYIKENIKSGDLLIIMGAGDIYKLVNRF